MRRRLTWTEGWVDALTGFPYNFTQSPGSWYWVGYQDGLRRRARLRAGQ